MVEYKCEALKCAWSLCTDPPTVRMYVRSGEYGSIQWNYCQKHVASHINCINEVNEQVALRQKPDKE